jgi:IS605 OrfB family transposase
VSSVDYCENTNTDKMPTACTLLPKSLDPFLNAMSALYSGIEHDMHALLSKGDAIGSIELSLQVKYGVDSTTTRNVWHNLKGKQSSVAELQAIEAKDIKDSIVSIEKAVKKLEKTVKQKRKDKVDFSKEKFTIHQKKRRLEIKRNKLTRALTNQSLCFGTKKLFNAQHHLEANGYSTHEEWREDWRAARTSNFMMVGSKIYKGGNQLCRLGSDGSLMITVPKCLIPQLGTHISCSDIFFRYGQGWIDSALEPKTYISQGKKQSSRIGASAPLTHRFCWKDGRWYLHTTVERPELPWISSKANGAIGIDLNVDTIAWAHCDHNGNLKAHGQVAIELKDKSTQQTQDILSKAVVEIITLARTLQCPIVIEKLDFSQKKAGLREQGTRYAEMLSSFAYAKFSELVQSKAYYAQLQVIEVNPAYSSLIGLTKFMSMYGLNSGTAAGLVLARRCFRFSERLPLPVMALVSPVDGTRHLWSTWRRVAKKLKGANRHSYFAMKVRVGVTLIVHSVERLGKILGKSKDTPIIPSGVGALPPCSSTVGLPSFAQLCLDFQ